MEKLHCFVNFICSISVDHDIQVDFTEFQSQGVNFKMQKTRFHKSSIPKFTFTSIKQYFIYFSYSSQLCFDSIEQWHRDSLKRAKLTSPHNGCTRQPQADCWTSTYPFVLFHFTLNIGEIINKIEGIWRI